eukprot:8339941-Pyramimonas_sp.AAC.1
MWKNTTPIRTNHTADKSTHRTLMPVDDVLRSRQGRIIGRIWHEPLGSHHRVWMPLPVLLPAPLQQGPLFSSPAVPLQRMPITSVNAMRTRASFHPTHGTQWAVYCAHLM